MKKWIAILPALILLASCGLGAPKGVTRGVSSDAPSSHTPSSASSAAPSSPTGPSSSPNPSNHQTHPDNPDWGPILPKHRIVSYYGNPLSTKMGVLGRGSTASMIARLKKQAAAYASADPTHPVWPALELVTVVAQRSPGPNGYYSHVMPDKLIRKEIALAKQHHFLLILDVQVGRASVKHWVEYLHPYLTEPNVELAIDPEFDMAPGGIPGIYLGRTYASSINWAAEYLSQIAKQYHQSQKVFIVHQFYRSALPDWKKIHTAPGVALVKDEDAFGGVGDKVSRYTLYIGKDKTPCLVGQSSVCGGFKLFYLQDHPLLTPKKVIALKPSPIVVIYQ